MWIYLGQLLNGLNQGETSFPGIGLSDWADVCAIQQYIALRCISANSTSRSRLDCRIGKLKVNRSANLQAVSAMIIGIRGCVPARYAACDSSVSTLPSITGPLCAKVSIMLSIFSLSRTDSADSARTRGVRRRHRCHGKQYSSRSNRVRRCGRLC